MHDVVFVDRFNGYAWIDGVLKVNSVNVLFIDRTSKYEFRLEISLIDVVERHNLAVFGTPLTIKSKNFRVSCFIFRQNNNCLEFCEELERSRQIYNVESLPCFTRWPPDHPSKPDEGWNRFDLRADFARMGLPSASWVEFSNKIYEHCDTYPSVMFVPKSADLETILGSASFRSRRRFPILTWIHPNGRSVICRSSQPLSGLTGKNKDDQELLRKIRLAGMSAVTVAPKGLLPLTPRIPPYLYVVDTRPRLNALTNRAQGKGYEDENVYEDIIFRFVEIPNIHVVRGSLEKMLTAYQMPKATMMELNQAVDKSGWLRILRRITEAAYFIASRLMTDDDEEYGYSFLVHCSDGWDRTAQVCSLAQLLIDPYYRTYEGFQALVEKDWLHFGHKFGSRCGQTRSVDSKEIAPIFTQFLDCTRHLLEFMPTAFEFNTRFLAALHDHSQSGVFGTFVGCSEKERVSYSLEKRTPSSWTYFANRRSLYLNPLYQPSEEYRKASEMASDRPPHIISLLPAFVTSPHLYSVWKDLFLQYEWRIPHTTQRMQEALKNLQTQTLALNIRANRLRQRIREVGKLLGKSDEDLDRLICIAEKRRYATVKNDTPKRSANVEVEANQCRSYSYGSLTRSVIRKNMFRTYTQPVIRLIPGTLDTCHSCDVLLATRTPCILCSRCDRLVCSICYVFVKSAPDSELNLPICRVCDLILTSSSSTAV
ncbi:unnamed protein product [Hymenolepis diminuta]|uniref:Myotubularin phosphatase domain-containing protein n=2 Tax=Hymenolepis diminuta TaxID=6216 RepID=A0A158QD23_HYMDI|nr:unnamed protein product [Hymenolepis diminuta]